MRKMERGRRRNKMEIKWIHKHLFQDEIGNVIDFVFAFSFPFFDIKQKKIIINVLCDTIFYVSRFLIFKFYDVDKCSFAA